ncbi:MAG TPA: AAA family ATPase [Nitrospira sp.]|nr:AAA family ATPase [Nitrospira sp.]
MAEHDCDDRDDRDDCEYLVDSILPTQEMHLLGGPSGSGKSTFLFKFLQSWSRGEPQWNYPSHPVPYLYVSLDRSSKGVVRTLRRMGIDISTIPYFAGFDDPTLVTIDDVLGAALRFKPDARLFVVEGIAGKVPKNKINDYGEVAAFVSHIGRWCRQFNATVIGTMHAAKTKANEQYDNPRQRILGSVAWGAFTETIIGLEPIDAKDPECRLRRLYLLPRNAPEQTFDMEWQGGHLVPATADTMVKQRRPKRGRPDNALKEALEGIQRYLKDQQIKRITFGELLNASPLPPATLNRGVRTLIESGFLKVLKKGYYEVMLFDDPLVADESSLPPQPKCFDSTITEAEDENDSPEGSEIEPEADEGPHTGEF